MPNHFKGLLHLSYFTTFAYEFSQIKTTEFVITLKRPLVNARSGDDNVIQTSNSGDGYDRDETTEVKF